MAENLYTPNSIRTFTGKYFDLLIQDSETICIEDIAHGLSQTARFGGQLKEMYTVAQHCVWMAQRAPLEFKMATLLHDASEAYLGDMPSPFKALLPDYKKIENELMGKIASKWKFEFPLNPIIKSLDKHALEFEWNQFVLGNDRGIKIWDPVRAEFEFLNYYQHIINKRV